MWINLLPGIFPPSSASSSNWAFAASPLGDANTYVVPGNRMTSTNPGSGGDNFKPRVEVDDPRPVFHPSVIGLGAGSPFNFATLFTTYKLRSRILATCEPNLGPVSIAPAMVGNEEKLQWTIPQLSKNEVNVIDIDASELVTIQNLRFSTVPTQTGPLLINVRGMLVENWVPPTITAGEAVMGFNFGNLPAGIPPNRTNNLIAANQLIETRDGDGFAPFILWNFPDATVIEQISTPGDVLINFTGGQNRSSDRRCGPGFGTILAPFAAFTDTCGNDSSGNVIVESFVHGEPGGGGQGCANIPGGINVEQDCTGKEPPSMGSGPGASTAFGFAGSGGEVHPASFNTDISCPCPATASAP